MTSNTYTLAEAAEARRALIEECQDLLHVAVFDIEDREIGIALKEIAERKSTTLGKGSHDTHAFYWLAEAFVDRVLACSEHILLDLPDHIPTETKETQR